MEPYEEEFLALARVNRLRVRRDEDGTPVLVPRPSKKNNGVKICPRGPDLAEISFRCPTPRRLSGMVGRLLAMRFDFPPGRVGDREASFDFPAEMVYRVAKVFGCVKKPVSVAFTGGLPTGPRIDLSQRAVARPGEARSDA